MPRLIMAAILWARQRYVKAFAAALLDFKKSPW